MEAYDHTGVVTDIIKVKNYQGEGDDMLSDISFVPESGERRMENFTTDVDFKSVKHPIVLDKTNMDSLEVSKGDELTITWGNKEFTFTIIGFYEA